MESFYNSRVETKKQGVSWDKCNAWTLVKYFMEDLYHKGEGYLEKARGVVGQLLTRYDDKSNFRSSADKNQYSSKDYTNMLQRIAALESQGDHKAVKDVVNRLKSRNEYIPPKELSKLTVASYFTKEVLENDDTFSYYYNNILSPFHNHIVSFDIIPTIKYTTYLLSTQHFFLQLPYIAYANDKTALMLRIGDVAIQNSIYMTGVQISNYIKQQLDDTTGSLCISYGLTQGLTSFFGAGFSKMLFPQLGASILAGQVLSKITFSTTQCYLGQIDQSEIETSKLLFLSSVESIFTGGFFLNLFFKQLGVFNDLVKSIGFIKNLITGVNIINTADLLTKYYIVSSYEGPDKYLKCHENCHGLRLEANYLLNKDISQNDGLLNQWVYQIGKFAKDKDGENIILHNEYCSLVKYLQNYKSAKHFTISEKNFYTILEGCKLSDDSKESNEQNMEADSGMIPRIDYDINRVRNAIEKVSLLSKGNENNYCIQQTKVSHFNLQNYFNGTENKLDFNVSFGCFSYHEVVELKINYPWLHNGMLTLDMSLDVEEKLQKFCQIPEKIILGCGQKLLMHETEQIISDLKAANPEEEFQVKEWSVAIELLISSELSYVDSKGLDNGCEVQRVEYQNHCKTIKLPKQMLNYLFNKHVTEDDNYVEENMLHKISYKKLDDIAGVNNMLYWLADYDFKNEKIDIGGIEKLVYKKVDK